MKTITLGRVSQIKELDSHPLFIIGMPRSGTKLLRALINNHPCVAIAPIETEFLPYWVNNWESIGKNIQSLSQFKLFYSKIKSYPYFIYMKERGCLISASEWHAACESYTPADVFEALIRHDAQAGNSMIWGDKSPSYINHVPLLKKIYPNAKIILIVRDVRDYCLSINKAWGKNIYRAAQRWNDDIKHAVDDMNNYSDDCLTIKYEDLLSTPDNILNRICIFLHIDFNECMLDLPGDTENLGDAKGAVSIVHSNINKYKKYFSENVIVRIEELSCNVLNIFNYNHSDNLKLKRVSSLMMNIYSILDGINLILRSTKKNGVIKSLFFHSKYRKITGNRQ